LRPELGHHLGIDELREIAEEVVDIRVILGVVRRALREPEEDRRYLDLGE
jgi:hypothetical protein